MNISKWAISGQTIISICNFTARSIEDDDIIVINKSNKAAINIGDKLIYLKTYYEAYPDDNPIGSMIVFQLVEDPGIFYIGSSDYFIIEEFWDGILHKFKTSP